MKIMGEAAMLHYLAFVIDSELNAPVNTHFAVPFDWNFAKYMTIQLKPSELTC